MFEVGDTVYSTEVVTGISGVVIEKITPELSKVRWEDGSEDIYLDYDLS